MTDIVPVPPAPSVPQYPQLGDPDFNTKAYNVGTNMPIVTQGLHDIATATHTNATAADERATIAQQSAVDAVAAKDAAYASSNFKGLWVNLSGPLNMPASVKHNGRNWLLVQNVADVAAEEPGVSSAWTSDASSVAIQEVSGSQIMQPGVRYVVTASGITLTIPASLIAGDQFSVMNASDGDFSVDWNGHTVKGKDPDSPMAIEQSRGFSVSYSGSTLA